MRHRLPDIALLVAVVAFCGCDDKSPNAGTSSAQFPKPDMEAARAFYAQECASCHGEKGWGDGPEIGKLPKKPYSLAEPAWQLKVTDARLRTSIVQGGVAVGASSSMPASPQLKDKPEVVEGLVKMVRSFK